MFCLVLVSFTVTVYLSVMICALLCERGKKIRSQLKLRVVRDVYLSFPPPSLLLLPTKGWQWASWGKEITCSFSYFAGRSDNESLPFLLASQMWELAVRRKSSLFLGSNESGSHFFPV